MTWNLNSLHGTPYINIPTKEHVDDAVVETLDGYVCECNHTCIFKAACLLFKDVHG